MPVTGGRVPRRAANRKFVTEPSVLGMSSRTWMFGVPGIFETGKSSGEGTRTPDPADMSRLLYQLSYAAMRLR